MLIYRCPKNAQKIRDAGVGGSNPLTPTNLFVHCRSRVPRRTGGALSFDPQATAVAVSKVIFFLLVIVALYVLVRAKRGRGASAPGPRSRDDMAEAIVACAHCGVHVPSSEAITADGRSYCCEEHRQIG